MPQTRLVSQRVEFGTFEHLLPVVLGIVCSIFIIYYAKKRLNLKQQHTLFNVLGWLVCITILADHGYAIYKGSYDFESDLPLWICSVMGLLMPIFTHLRKYWMFEILLFWVLGGSTQGIIIPNIQDGFLSFEYFRYWLTHFCLYTIMFYAIIIFKMWPNFKSPIKSILVLQLYVLIIFFLNLHLGTNFFFLSAKPNFASPLDYLGDWPYYIVVGQLILIPFFLLLYLPFYIIRNKKRVRTIWQKAVSHL